MYQHLILSIMLAAPAAAQTPATTKPAAPASKPAATQKPAAGTEKPAPAASAKGVRTVEIVGSEDMKFSLATITAKPGEQLRVRLVAKGSMPKVAMSHNFVLLKKSASPVDFVAAAVMASATGYIPADKKADVLANTELAGAGETVEVVFKAPAVAGDYPYLCSFPGHFQAGMKGTLSVK
jgi:azurin